MFNIVCTLISLFLKKPTSFNTRKITMHWDHVCTNANKSHTNTDALERRGWGRKEEEREMQMAHSLILRMLDQEKQSLPEHSSNARNHFFLVFFKGIIFFVGCQPCVLALKYGCEGRAGLTEDDCRKYFRLLTVLLRFHNHSHLRSVHANEGAFHCSRNNLVTVIVHENSQLPENGSKHEHHSSGQLDKWRPHKWQQ